MKSIAFFSVFLAGCSPASLVIEGHSGSTGTDSTVPTTETTVTGTQTTSATTTTATTPTSSTTSTTTTTGTTITTADELLWSGERFIDMFSVGCEDYIYEEGVEVTEDALGQDLLDACGDCTRVWEVAASPESVCGYGVTPVVYRGLEFRDDGSVTVYSFSDEGSYWDADFYGSGNLSADGTLEYEHYQDWYTAYGLVDLSPIF